MGSLWPLSAVFLTAAVPAQAAVIGGPLLRDGLDGLAGFISYRSVSSILTKDDASAFKPTGLLPANTTFTARAQ